MKTKVNNMNSFESTYHCLFLSNETLTNPITNSSSRFRKVTRNRGKRSNNRS